MRKKIVALYPYYWPLYKAGGPVQSLYNLNATFKDQLDFYFISLDKDIDGHVPDHPLKLNEWSQGPNKENIYSTSFLSPLLILRLLREVNPDVIMVNGIFHWHTAFFGILCAKRFKAKLIISPRGMLQAWALERGKFKKTIFLRLLKSFLRKDEIWHATDTQEQEDIYRIFGSQQQVHVASNIPRTMGKSEGPEFPGESGKVKLVFLSLINPNKNLHLIIDEVNKFEHNFSLDIYGPVIAKDYWKLCQDRIKDSSQIVYQGAVPPWEVPVIFSHYHFFVLPTRGENFGHAIFDALASGLPVIIPRTTPWQRLDEFGAGFYIDLEKQDSLFRVMSQIIRMDASTFARCQAGSLAYARDYWSGKNYFAEYNFLFTS